MHEDIAPILDAWEYKPGEVIVRKVTGADGKPKLQMRLDLGLLQMELDGRPDGRRPHGQESLLEHYIDSMERHRTDYETEAGFTLSPDDCYLLQEEALQYYHRYLSLLAIGDFARAERDTARNLRVFDLVWKHAQRESDKWALERYRPYVLMMNTRARASASLKAGRRDEAIRHIKDGMRRIEQFLAGREQETLRDQSAEVGYLKAWLQEIRDSHPPGEADKLRDELEWAVDVEDYERAAKIRDQLRKLHLSDD